MTKLLKKSLALVLTLALCLSAMACCFIVSAEDETTPNPAITIAVDNATPAPGAEVTVTVTADWDGAVAGAEFTVVGIPAGATITLPAGVTDPVLNQAADGSIKYVDGSNVVLTSTLLFTATFTASEEVNTVYTFAIDDASYTFCNVDEEDIAVTSNSATATVTEVVVEPEEPEVEVTSATYNHSISLNAGLAVNIYLLQTDDWASCSNLYMEIETEDYSTGELTYTTETLYVASMEPVYLSKAYRYQFVYTGIDAREIASRFTATVYGVDAKGNVIFTSDVDDDYSVLDYCVSQFGKTNEAFKVVLADLLNYGAAAQANFSYRVNEPVNTLASVVDYVEQYETKTAPTLDATSSKEGTGVNISNTVTCESVVELVCAVKKADVAAYDFDSLKFKLTYGGNTYEMDSSVFTNLSTDTYYRAYYGGLLSTQFSEDIIIGLYEGDTLISVIRTYSIEAYCISQIEKYAVGTTQNTLYTMLMTYGYSAANYF